MHPTDDTIGSPDFMHSLMSMTEKQFATALGYDPEIFSWVTDRIESLFRRSIELESRAVFGTLKDDLLVFLIFPAGAYGEPEQRVFKATNPAYFDSTLGLQIVSESAYYQTCEILKEFGGVADLVLMQYMMGLITFEEAKRYSFEQSVRHAPA